MCSGTNSLLDEAAELGSRLDAELAVDAGQVGFDRLRADEQCGGDVTSRHPRGRQLSDPPFRRSQPHVLGRTGRCAGQFRTGASGP